MEKKTLHVVIILFVSLMVLFMSCNASSPKTYTISFDINGADGGSPPDPIIIMPHDSPVSAPSYGSLYKTGYSFCGWSTEQNNLNESSLIHSGELLNLQKNTTLYAIWDIPCKFLLWGESNYIVSCNNKNIEYCSIPSVYDGKPVTIINNIAFSGCRFLKSITLPENLTTIGYMAFKECISLQSIILPESLNNIDLGVFKGCISLKEINIPSLVKSIGSDAFQGCTSLQFVTLPEGLKEINKGAFQDCTALREITIPSSVTMIMPNVFQGCSALKSVTLSEGITYIGKFAFNNCISLAEINIPSTVTEIVFSAFEGCSSLQSINYKGTKAQWGTIKKGESWDKNTGNYIIHCTDGDIPNETD